MLCHRTGFPSFQEGIIIFCVYILQFTYPLICWRTYRLLPHFGYCEYCGSELGSANMYLRLGFKLFWVNDLDVEWVKPMIVLFFLFLTFWVTFIFFIMVTPLCPKLPGTRVLFSSIILPTLAILLFWLQSFFRCEVIHHCGFDLHFPDDS